MKRKAYENFKVIASADTVKALVQIFQNNIEKNIVYIQMSLINLDVLQTSKTIMNNKQLTSALEVLLLK